MSHIAQCECDKRWLVRSNNNHFRNNDERARARSVNKAIESKHFFACNEIAQFLILATIFSLPSSLHSVHAGKYPPKNCFQNKYNQRHTQKKKKYPLTYINFNAPNLNVNKPKCARHTENLYYFIHFVQKMFVFFLFRSRKFIHRKLAIIRNV